MRRLLILLIFVSLFSGCVASYLEEAAFLELPFEYEGKIDEWMVSSNQLKWGVPDNGDDNGIYLGDTWGGFYYWENGKIYYLWYSNLDSSYYRRIFSLDTRGWFINLYDNASIDYLALNHFYLDTWGTVTIDTPYVAGSSFTYGLTRLDGVDNVLLQSQTAGDPGISYWDIDTGTGFSAETSVLSSGVLPLNTVITTVFPGVDSFWGTPSAEVQVLAPAGYASFNGTHKYIISRYNGLTGEKLTALVSIEAAAPANFSYRFIEAAGDFHIISPDRFVGMKGNTLQIFNSAGDVIKGIELENMRLLGYRSSTEEELVFLYVSDEKDGDRVCGIYSLPAAFIQEVRE